MIPAVSKNAFNVRVKVSDNAVRLANRLADPRNVGKSLLAAAVAGIMCLIETKKTRG